MLRSVVFCREQCQIGITVESRGSLRFRRFEADGECFHRLVQCFRHVVQHD